MDVPKTAWRERAVDPPFSNNSGKLACTARRLIPMHADWKWGDSIIGLPCTARRTRPKFQRNIVKIDYSINQINGANDVQELLWAVKMHQKKSICTSLATK